MFYITIIGRGISMLRVITTVESFELEEVVNGITSIGIFSIGMVFLRKVHTRNFLTFAIVYFL